MEQCLDDNTESKLCEPCQGNVSRQADGYCNDCGEYMCQTCFQSHLKFKLGRNHVFEALDGGVRKVSPKLETKCRNHDSVGCELCLSDHPKCESGLIENQDMDQVRADLEKALERFWKTYSLEKEQKEKLEKACTTLKKELEDQRSLLSREREERELYINQTKDLEQTIVLLKQDKSSLNDLNIRLKLELDSCKKEFETLESNSKDRQKQDHRQIKSLQSEPTNSSESDEIERESPSSEQQRENEPKQQKNPLPVIDPPDVDFYVDDRVESTKPSSKGWKGTVTHVYPTGQIKVQWDNGKIGLTIAGAGGKYYVKKITK